MDTIQVLDKKFKISIPEAEILKSIDAVAERINKDMAGKNPLFMAVLNGSFIFAADLLRRITIPCEVSFVKLASYQGTLSSGKVTEVIGINENLAGRHHRGGYHRIGPHHEADARLVIYSKSRVGASLYAATETRQTQSEP